MWWAVDRRFINGLVLMASNLGQNGWLPHRKATYMKRKRTSRPYQNAGKLLMLLQKRRQMFFFKFHSSWVALFTVTTVDSSLNVHIWISPWPFTHHSRIPATVYRNNENKEQTQSRIPLIFGKKQNPSCVSPVVVKKEQKAKPHYRHPEEPNRLIKKR